jgi:hypothetical protein
VKPHLQVRVARQQARGAQRHGFPQQPRPPQHAQRGTGVACGAAREHYSSGVELHWHAHEDRDAC